MEYKIQKESNRKRKAEEEQTHNNNVTSHKTNSVACIEVLSKDYFHVYMKELEVIVNSGFTKLSSEISTLKAKLNRLDKSFESLKKTMKKDPKTTFNTTESTDSSVEILSVTPLKTNEMKKIDKKIKKYGMLLDTSERIGRHKQVVKSYDPFAVVDHGKAAWLDSWMKIDRDITINLGIIKADKTFFAELIEPTVWLSEEHIDVGMSLMRRKLREISCPFHSKRLAFLDVPFTLLISKNYQKFLESPENFDWSSDFISYYNGFLPKCERTHKRLGVDVDDAYVILNIKNVHWIALAISILHRTIEVYDSSLILSRDDEITEFVKPFAIMIPHLIRSLASPADQKALSDAEYTIIRCKKMPQNIQSGDCGVYAIKYIECLALDTDMEVGLCDANIKFIREKLAADMFAEGNHFEDFRCIIFVWF